MSTEMHQILDAARTLSPNQLEELIAALRSIEDTTPSGRRERLVHEIRGKYKHIPTSVEAFLQRKAADTGLESL